MLIPPISLDTANKFYAWGWRGSIIGAVVTAISVIFLMWGTLVRDRNSEIKASLAKAHSDALEAATNIALDEQKKLSDANTQLQSQIDKLRHPRKISEQSASQMSLIFHQSGAHSFQIVYAGMDPEAQSLADQIRGIFEAGGWKLLGQVMPQLDFTRPPAVGVEFGVKSQQNLPPTLVPFINLMRGEKLIGERASVELAPDLPDDQSIAVRVGRKPSQ